MKEMIRDLWRFFMERKVWWLLPLILALLLLGLIFVVAQPGAAVTPFIYAIF